MVLHFYTDFSLRVGLLTIMLNFRPLNVSYICVKADKKSKSHVKKMSQM